MSEWDAQSGQTAIDPSFLRRRAGITNRRELNAAEAENIRKAQVKYFTGRLTRRKARFDLNWCRRLHKEMFGDVWTFAGQLRTTNLNFGVDWPHVESQLYQLLRDLDSWSGFEVGLLEQAVRLHIQSVRIHPFRDGNGRWSRMLSNTWLRLHDHPLVEWPAEVSRRESIVRNEYIASIDAAINEGREAPLIELHRRFLAG